MTNELKNNFAIFKVNFKVNQIISCFKIYVHNNDTGK